MTTKLPAWTLYLLAEVGIVGSWLISILTPGGADFSTLAQTGPLKALVILEVTWAVACAAHAKATGDWTPVEGVTAELKPGIQLATADQVDSLFLRLSAQIQRIEPQQPPAIPPPPSLEDFHRNEAG